MTTTIIKKSSDKAVKAVDPRSPTPQYKPSPRADSLKHRPLDASSSSLFILLFGLFSAYMYNGMEYLSYDYWIPLVGIGYVRWDLALIGSAVECVVVHRLVTWCWRQQQRRRRVLLMVISVFTILLLIMGYLFLPRPPYFWTRSPVLFQYKDTDYHHPNASSVDTTTNNNNMTIHHQGLTRTQSHALAHTIYQFSSNWTHMTSSYGRAHAYYGTSLQHDDQHDDDRLPFYSLRYGFGHYTMERAARESLFRKHFIEHIQQVQEHVRTHIWPLVRPLYARAVHASSDTDIVLGEDYMAGLGFPTVLIRMPHRMAQWWMHPQTNTVHQRRFDEIMKRRTNESNPNACHLLNTTSHTNRFQTFLLPLLIPYGSGIRQWTMTKKKKNKTHHTSHQDYLFRYGQIYQYPASTVHALLSSSRTFVPEWWDPSRGIFMVLEAMAVPCDDGRWIFFH